LIQKRISGFSRHEQKPDALTIGVEKVVVRNFRRQKNINRVRNARSLREASAIKFARNEEIDSAELQPPA